jgi:membrane protein involved in colicin uptake
MNEPVKYNVNEAEISKMASIYLNLTIEGLDDKEGFESVHSARMVMVKHRTGVDKMRKKANEEAQLFIKNNNTNAKKLLDLMEPIETHLTTEEEKVTKEKERIKAEEEARNRAKIESRINGLLKYGVVKPFMEVATMGDGEYDALLFSAKTTYEIEQKRIADEKAQAEADRLALQKICDEENARLEVQRKEQEAERLRLDNIRKEQEEATRKIEAEKKALEDEKRKEQERKDRETFEKQAAENARIKAEKEAIEKAEREAREKKEREEAEAAEKARREELKPDKVKLIAYANNLLAYVRESSFAPKNKAVKKILIEAEHDLESIALNILNKVEGL